MDDSSSKSGDSDEQSQKKRLPPFAKPAAPAPQRQAKKISDEDIRKMFQQIYKMQDMVAKNLDEAYKLMGKRPTEIKNFLDNPNNFPNEQLWKMVQEARAYKLRSLEKTILYEGQEPPKGQNFAIEEKKKKAKQKKEEGEAEKKRKGKTLGRRKGWLSM